MNRYIYTPTEAHPTHSYIYIQIHTGIHKIKRKCHQIDSNMFDLLSIKSDVYILKALSLSTHEST